MDYLIYFKGNRNTLLTIIVPSKLKLKNALNKLKKVVYVLKHPNKRKQL